MPLRINKFVRFGLVARRQFKMAETINRTRCSEWPFVGESTRVRLSPWMEQTISEQNQRQTSSLVLDGAGTFIAGRDSKGSSFRGQFPSQLPIKYESRGDESHVDTICFSLSCHVIHYIQISWDVMTKLHKPDETLVEDSPIGYGEKYSVQGKVCCMVPYIGHTIFFVWSAFCSVPSVLS